MKSKKPRGPGNSSESKPIDSDMNSERREFLQKLAAASGSLLTSGIFGGTLFSSETAEAQFAGISAWQRHQGTLWVWGYNLNGELGTGTSGSPATDRKAPFRLTGPVRPWVDIGAGQFVSVGLKKDGSLWAWGKNDTGACGQGDSALKTSPVRISGTWSKIWVGYNHVFARKSDETIWRWGDNNYGQMANGSTSATGFLNPTQYTTALTLEEFSCGYAHNFAWGGNPVVAYAWGNNGWGQLGLGNTTQYLTPTVVPAPVVGTTWVRLVAGHQHSLGMASNGTLWAWGSNNYGQLGYGGPTNNSGTRDFPVQIVLPAGTPVGPWKDFSCGYYHSAAIHNDGSLWTWGRNANGQLGLGTTAEWAVPQKLTTGQWLKVSCGWAHTAAIQTDGTLWVWGYNGYGELGLNDLTQRTSPVQVTSPAGTWEHVSCNDSRTLAIRK